MLHAAVAVALLASGADAFVGGPAAFTTGAHGRVAPISKMGLRSTPLVFGQNKVRPAVMPAAAGLRMSAAAPAGLDTAALSRAATEARGLAMDSIAKAHSGHLGLPLGCAEVSILLFLLRRLDV